jgi:hypothetical protein
VWKRERDLKWFSEAKSDIAANSHPFTYKTKKKEENHQSKLDIKCQNYGRS